MTNTHLDFQKISKALTAWEYIIHSEEATDKAHEQLNKATNEYEQALSFRLTKTF